MALNCLNGTLDLRTGELSPHRRADLMTMMAAQNMILMPGRRSGRVFFSAFSLMKPIGAMSRKRPAIH